MIKSHIVCLLSLATLPAVVPAQQTYELWPGRTNFTSRGDLGVGPGETLQGIHATHHRGIGDTGTACELANFVGMVQDQNAATRETFHWVIRGGSDTSGPGADSASLLGMVGPLVTPNSASTGPAAWSLTTSLTKPVKLVNCRSHLSFGLRLPASPNWTRDGFSTHTSFGSTAYPTQGTHSRAEDHAWQVVSTATVATHPSNKRTWRYGLLLDNGVLQLGNGAALYGMGGMFPAANNPVTARARYGSKMSGGASVLYLSTGRMNGVRVLPNTSRTYLTGMFYTVSTQMISATGEAIHTIQTSLPAACAGSPRHYVQAFGTKRNMYVVTNLHAVNP